MTRPTDHTHRCQNYTNGHRCTALATHRFLVDGVPVTYAGYTCQVHGDAVVAEYARIVEIVGTWTIEALDATVSPIPPFATQETQP